MNIEQMAEEAFGPLWGAMHMQMLERFAALVRAHALEEAAAECWAAYDIDGQHTANVFAKRVLALKAPPDAEVK